MIVMIYVLSTHSQKFAGQLLQTVQSFEDLEICVIKAHVQSRQFPLATAQEADQEVTRLTSAGPHCKQFIYTLSGYILL